MADNPRIDDLRRRVLKDPASIAFAQLAEECRRAGFYEESVEVCRAGLAIHPGYLSARVTLGRALIELNQLVVAEEELAFVLKNAPENLAAIRGLAEINRRNGSLADALKYYRAALALASNDPDLQDTVAELERAVEPPKPPASADGLSFAEMQSEFLAHSPPPPKPPPLALAVPPRPVEPAPDIAEPAPLTASPGAAPPVTEPPVTEPPVTEPGEPAPQMTPSPEPAAPALASPEPAAAVMDVAEPPPQTMALVDPAAPVTDLSEPETPVVHVPEPPAAATDLSEPAGPAADVPVPAEALMVLPEPAAPQDEDHTERDLALRTIAALEQWLDAIHVTRAHSHS